jgi:hypothetical protein
MSELSYEKNKISRYQNDIKSNALIAIMEEVIFNKIQELKKDLEFFDKDY